MKPFAVHCAVLEVSIQHMKKSPLYDVEISVDKKTVYMTANYRVKFDTIQSVQTEEAAAAAAEFSSSSSSRNSRSNAAAAAVLIVETHDGKRFRATTADPDDPNWPNFVRVLQERGGGGGKSTSASAAAGTAVRRAQNPTPAVPLPRRIRRGTFGATKTTTTTSRSTQFYDDADLWKEDYRYRTTPATTTEHRQSADATAEKPNADDNAEDTSSNFRPVEPDEDEPSRSKSAARSTKFKRLQRAKRKNMFDSSEEEDEDDHIFDDNNAHTHKAMTTPAPGTQRMVTPGTTLLSAQSSSHPGRSRIAAAATTAANQETEQDNDDAELLLDSSSSEEEDDGTRAAESAKLESPPRNVPSTRQPAANSTTLHSFFQPKVARAAAAAAEEMTNPNAAAAAAVDAKRRASLTPPRHRSSPERVRTDYHNNSSPPRTTPVRPLSLSLSSQQQQHKKRPHDDPMPLMSPLNWLQSHPHRSGGMTSMEKRKQQLLGSATKLRPATTSISTIDCNRQHQKPLHEKNQSGTNILDDDPIDSYNDDTPNRRLSLKNNRRSTTARKRMTLTKVNGNRLTDRVGGLLSPLVLNTDTHTTNFNTNNSTVSGGGNSDHKASSTLRRRRPPFRGLRNLGNTCYLNASLQMLLSCPTFIAALQKSRGRGNPLADSIAWVSDRLLPPAYSSSVINSTAAVQQPDVDPYAPLSPTRVKDAVDAKTDKFAGSEQRDAHEFISDLVDYVHEELETEYKQNKTETVTVPPIGLNHTTDGGKPDAFPTDDFCFTVLVALQCCSCGYSRNKEEMYRHLSIDIVSNDNNNSDRLSEHPSGIEADVSRVTVEKSLNHFFQPELREITCEKCTTGTHAQQTLRILSRPKVLLLHLKRFIFVERAMSPVSNGDENQSPNCPTNAAPVEYVFKKNKEPVLIPPSIALDQFLATQPLQDGLTDKSIGTSIDHPDVYSYSLKSIVHHIGSRASSGHYTADALRQETLNWNNSDTLATNTVTNEEAVWVTYDDSFTTRTTLTKILDNRFKQQSAYMLLYTANDSDTPVLVTDSSKGPTLQEEL